MNCTRVEPLILLQDSGEITESDRKDLAAHLADCAACRQVRTELALLRMALRDPHGVQDGPSEGILATIMTAARHQPPRHKIHPWRVAMAVAAAAAVCLVSVKLVTHSLGPQSDSFAAGDSVMDVLPLVAFMDDPATLQANGDAGEINSLADQLLRLQGMDMEETEEAVMLPEDNPPIALQSRNKRASLAERYG